MENHEVRRGASSVAVLIAGSVLAGLGILACQALLGPIPGATEDTAVLAASLLAAGACFVLLRSRVSRMAGAEMEGLRGFAASLALGRYAIPARLENCPGDTLAASMTAVARHLEALSHAAIDGAEDVNSSVEQLSASANEILFNSQMQAASIGSAKEMMADMSQRIANVSGLVQDTERHSRQAATLTADGEAVVEQAVREMQSISDAMTGASGQIHTLLEHAENIGKVAVVIKDIASQTNLLALNAAIEAARAGDSGRGFAVVADEVRALSERTELATKEIAQTIKLMQDQTRSAVTVIGETLPLISSGTERANGAANALRAIRSETESTLDHISQLVVQADEQAQLATSVVGDVSAVLDMAGQTDAVADRAVQTSVRLTEAASRLMEVAKGDGHAAS